MTDKTALNIATSALKDILNLSLRHINVLRENARPEVIEMRAIAKDALARNAIDALDAAPLPVLPQTKPIPLDALTRILNEVMELAVKNGANSVSMPDQYVAAAHFLAYPHEYYPAAQAAPSLPAVDPMDAWLDYAKRSGLLDENGEAIDRRQTQTAWFAFISAWNRCALQSKPASTVAQPGDRYVVFGYFHELLDAAGKGHGIWLGCPDRSSTERAYIEGETGKEIVTLYTATPQSSSTAAQKAPQTNQVGNFGDSSNEQIKRRLQSVPLPNYSEDK